MTQHIHFIGIGGIGTSALAQWYLASGCMVSGTDAVASEVTDLLASKGIAVSIGDTAQSVQGAELVIHSAAVKEDNPALAAAKKAGIKTLLYGQALGEVSKQYKTIAISGAHGKSTTTAMLAGILIDAGVDPTVIVGTKMKSLDGNNFRPGKGEYLVIEADDFNRHFLELHQFISVVTNIDAEHLDIYKDLAGVKQAFTQFISNTADSGYVVANGQDDNTVDVLQHLIDLKPELHLYNEHELASYQLKLPGEHNQSNSEAAATVSRLLGIKNDKIEESLSNFGGIWRRLEELQEGVFSDYAHHPTEIRATLKAFKEANPGKKIIVVFEPHQRKRLVQLFDQFVDCFDDADEVLLLPVYVVRGRDDATGVDSADLANTIGRASVRFVPDFEQAFEYVKTLINSNNIVVFMGAGSIDQQARDRL